MRADLETWGDRAVMVACLVAVVLYLMGVIA